jgi:hypothetical protein
MGGPGTGCWMISRSPPRNAAHVHSTVGSVSPSPGLGGLVNNNVLDNQLLNSEVLSVGVGLGVLKETEEELNGFDGPST